MLPCFPSDAASTRFQFEEAGTGPSPSASGRCIFFFLAQPGSNYLPT